MRKSRAARAAVAACVARGSALERKTSRPCKRRAEEEEGGVRGGGADAPRGRGGPAGEPSMRLFRILTMTTDCDRHSASTWRKSTRAVFIRVLSRTQAWCPLSRMLQPRPRSEEHASPTGLQRQGKPPTVIHRPAPSSGPTDRPQPATHPTTTPPRTRTTLLSNSNAICSKNPANTSGTCVPRFPRRHGIRSASSRRGMAVP